MKLECETFTAVSFFLSWLSFMEADQQGKYGHIVQQGKKWNCLYFSLPFPPSKDCSDRYFQFCIGDNYPPLSKPEHLINRLFHNKIYLPLGISNFISIVDIMLELREFPKDTLHEKPYFLFPNVLKRLPFQNLVLEYDLSCIIRKDGIFSRKYDLILQTENER